MRVEVLNGTGERRLAARVALLLRSRGYDVVATGNADTTDTTTILLRRGRVEAARGIAAAIGGAVIREEIDSSLQLEASVILGRDLAVVLPFHP